MTAFQTFCMVVGAITLASLALALIVGVSIWLIARNIGAITVDKEEGEE